MNYQNLLEKLFVILCLLAAIYYVAICPCKVILTCQSTKFYILILIPLAYIFFRQRYAALYVK